MVQWIGIENISFDLKYISEGYRGICCTKDIMEGNFVL